MEDCEQRGAIKKFFSKCAFKKAKTVPLLLHVVKTAPPQLELHIGEEEEVQGDKSAQ